MSRPTATLPYSPPDVSADDTWTDVRCPLSRTRADGSAAPGRLLMKLFLPSLPASPPGLISVSCPDCRTRLRKTGVSVSRVLHWYALDGTLTSVTAEGV
jgi:hypothetical protein